MLQIARLSTRQLGESARLIVDFLHSQQDPGGGFQNRAGATDLYYTVFGLEALIALGAELPTEQVSTFLRSFGAGENLDLLHLCCLIRCWANIRRSGPPLDTDSIAARIERYRTADGGYNTVAGAEHCTAYACFLVKAAYDDLRGLMPHPEGVARALRALRAADGGFANQPHAPSGTTPSTAAAATLFRQLGEDPPPDIAEWLMARFRGGGFCAASATPIPDLLSTATALHALAGMKAPIDALREPCLDFIDTLWTNAGGFYGNWGDHTLDCEYTYYGLLALGHLSL